MKPLRKDTRMPFLSTAVFIGIVIIIIAIIMPKLDSPVDTEHL